MSDPAPLLTTLAQSSAAIVAIVGGFLVSRLVALSSEREGLSRQLRATRDRLGHVRPDYDAAHKYRFENSESTFTGWVLKDLAEDKDPKKILVDNIPRGSSEQEMGPVLDALLSRAADAGRRIREVVDPTDTSDLTLDDLIERGLDIPEEDSDLFDNVFERIASALPESTNRRGISPSFRIPYLGRIDSVTEMRRLDESIREEQQLHSDLLILEADERRLTGELDAIGRPAGVGPAITILGTYSVLGIVVPVAVMASNPDGLAGWQTALLVGLFAVGLFAVLGYIVWYWRTLGSSVDKQSQTPTSAGEGPA